MAHSKNRRPAQWTVQTWFLPVVTVLAIAGFCTSVFMARRRRPLSWDLKTTLALQRFRNPVFYRLMVLVSSLGYAPVIQFILVLVSGILWLTGRKMESLFSLGSAGATALVVLVKNLVGRPRPGGDHIRVAIRLPDYGFPSGHTVHYVSFYGFLAYLAATELKTGFLRDLVLIVIALLITIVGPSRIYLGEHWLSDVIAAYLFGMAYLAGLINVYKRIKATMFQQSSKR